MSREIRPVALDWEHPQMGGTYYDGTPRYRALHSREDLLRHLDWNTENPDDLIEIDPADYMPELKEGTPFGWQMYQTVSEGSPVSPVFATKDELAQWLSSPAAGREQCSPEAARKFTEDGWAPSFVSVGGQFMRGIDHLAVREP
jgi:hypothetical protein